jgi:hypothetical protein
MARFLKFEAQDGNPRLARSGKQTRGPDDPTTGADGPTTNEHLCVACKSISLNDLVALNASVGLYLPCPSTPLVPASKCALCTLCRTRRVSDLIKDWKARKQDSIKRRELQTALGLSSRPPEKEFEKLLITLSSGRPQATIGVAAVYGKGTCESLF